MTSRYYNTVCLATPSTVLCRLFSNSYRDPDLLLLAAVRAPQLSDWILGPDGLSDYEQDKRLNRIGHEVISSHRPITETLSILPMTFRDLVFVRRFERKIVSSTVQWLRAIWPDQRNQRCTIAETRSLVLPQEAYYQLFYHTFSDDRPTSGSPISPSISIPAWEAMPFVDPMEERLLEVGSSRSIQQQFIKRFLWSPEARDLDMEHTGRRALVDIGIWMISRSRIARDRDSSPIEKPLHRESVHRQVLFLDRLLGLDDSPRWGLESCHLSLLHDLIELRSVF